MSGLKKGALTLALWLVLGVPHPVFAADPNSAVKISYSPPLLKVEARDANLLTVLREIGEKVGFSVVNYGLSDTIINVSIENGKVEGVLRQLLREENFAVSYWTDEKESLPQNRTIAQIALLSPPGHAEKAGNSEITAHQDNSSVGSAGLTRYSGESLEAKEQSNEQAQAEVTVGALMRAHAFSGLGGYSQGVVSEGVNQPLEKQVGSGGGLVSSTANRQTPVTTNKALAISTQLAQKNLKALIDGLATAELSLMGYRAQKRK